MGGENVGMRRTACIEIHSPEKGYCSCRVCGGEALVWEIKDMYYGDPKYFSCPRYWEFTVCGIHEVVTGTPMDFGDVAITFNTEEDKQRYLDMKFNAYNERRKQMALPLITEEEWKRTRG